jgi:hypothetical protein
MPDYTCEKCSKSFYDKSTLNKHIKNDTCLEKIKKKTCDICDKYFSTKASLQRHLNSKKHVTNLNSVTVNGNQNIVGNNNTNVNNCNIIIINPFLCDDMSKLSNNDKMKILKKCYMSIPELLKQINLNPKNPENHNVYISDMKSKYGHINNGKKWIIAKVDQLVDDIINKKRDDIEDLLEQFVDELPEKVIDKVRDVIVTLEYDPLSDDVPDKQKIKFRRMINDEIKLLLYNNKEIPMKTRKENEQKNKEKIKNKVE